LFAGLKDLEEDTHRHIHLENSVLFPAAEVLVSRKESPAPTSCSITPPASTSCQIPAQAPSSCQIPSPAPTSCKIR
jgi:hypothetical protein